jgi:hypothetical protein
MLELLTEAKNLHMEHLEDNILNGGVDGTRQTINFLRSLRDMLSGTSSSSVNISVKWDGAPSIFAGTDPRDGKFFVAKKSIFNKNPKVYKTRQDIDDDLSGDLREKFLTALKYLPQLRIDGIVQGDFLYTKNDLDVERINGKRYITFHPNTIVYAVPMDSELAYDIRRSKMGVVWHTKYVGRDFESLSAQYNQDIVSTMRRSNNVWFTDATYRDVSGTATMNSSETIEVNQLLSQAGSLFNKVKKREFDRLVDNEDLLIRLKTFNNSKVRDQQPIGDPVNHVKQFIEYVNAFFDRESNKRTTDRGKQGVEIKRRNILDDVYPEELVKIFMIYNIIIECKKILIKKLNRASSLDTFLLTNKGFKVTNQEGFVVADRFGSNAVKLIDRLEFSYSNFSSEVIKGFQR